MRAGGFLLFILAVLLGGLLLWGVARRDAVMRFEPFIQEAGNKYNIDPALVRAVIWRESNFNSRAIGLAQERGLMQVTPGAAKDWARAYNFESFQETDLFDARTNIQAGAWYLARAANNWKDADRPEVFALAEYNAGRVHSRRWARDLPDLKASQFMARIDFPTTKAYIYKVMDRYTYYRAHSNPGIPRVIQDQIVGFWLKWHDKRESSPPLREKLGK